MVLVVGPIQSCHLNVGKFYSLALPVMHKCSSSKKLTIIFNTIKLYFIATYYIKWGNLILCIVYIKLLFFDGKKYIIFRNLSSTVRKHFAEQWYSTKSLGNTKLISCISFVIAVPKNYDFFLFNRNTTKF